jgi:hypothetical protein
MQVKGKVIKAEKKLGIWMDHASARLMEFTIDPIVTKTILSKFSHQEKEQSLSKSENVMHNKEQHQQSEYYKLLGDDILGCTEVILFGPTNAKEELFNLLKADQRYAKIKIAVEKSDKMTEHQQKAFVNDYFSGL